MKFEIKDKITGMILFSIETSSWKSAIEAAIKSSADLRYANLSYADLGYADLSSADLICANLSSADLSSANLHYANLRYANLRSADLRYANLRSADLSSANLHSADLRYANLRSADLSSANLSYADLGCADLRSAKGSEYAIASTRILPEGSIIGWKKCRNNVIVKLRIPEESKRSHAFGRKCRAEYAEVLEVIGANEGVSSHDGETTYLVGKTVRADAFDDDFTNECSGGIHFFITREEAERY